MSALIAPPRVGHHAQRLSPLGESPAPLTLQNTPDGCALVDSERHIVFAARGRDARRRCLAHAQAAGILCLRADH